MIDIHRLISFIGEVFFIFGLNYLLVYFIFTIIKLKNTRIFYSIQILSCFVIITLIHKNILILV
jgi:hypothetical protein